MVKYVEKYNPDLVDSLAPIVSPMIAIARALRASGPDNMKIVFIGPCIAKKQEARSIHLDSEVDAALTFEELSSMFAEEDVTPESVEPADFDPPRAAYGALFPISRGLLQAAGMTETWLWEKWSSRMAERFSRCGKRIRRVTWGPASKYSPATCITDRGFHRSPRDSAAGQGG